MDGEDKFIGILKDRGYQIVYFEELSPQEQVACVNQARSIILQHGAGMANMLFASPSTHVFELGTYQTAIARWGDFIPLCHASQCHYHHITLDMNLSEDKTAPVFKEDGLLPPVLSNQAINQILEIVDGSLLTEEPGPTSAFLLQCNYLMEREAYRQTIRVLDYYKDALRDHSSYWDKNAKLNLAVGRIPEAADHFYRAWKISGIKKFAEEFCSLPDIHDTRRQELSVVM